LSTLVVIIITTFYHEANKRGTTSTHSGVKLWQF